MCSIICSIDILRSDDTPASTSRPAGRRRARSTTVNCVTRSTSPGLTFGVLKSSLQRRHVIATESFRARNRAGKLPLAEQIGARRADTSFLPPRRPFFQSTLHCCCCCPPPSETGMCYQGSRPSFPCIPDGIRAIRAKTVGTQGDGGVHVGEACVVADCGNTTRSLGQDQDHAVCC